MVDRFLGLKQRGMSVREYSLRFDSLARHAPTIVDTMRARIHRFVVGLDPYLIGDCTTTSLNENMDISRIQAYAQNVEGRKR